MDFSHKSTKRFSDIDYQKVKRKHIDCSEFNFKHLNHKFNELYDNLRLSEIEVKVRKYLSNRMQNILKEILKNEKYEKRKFEISVFGSNKIDTCLSLSDIDIIIIPNTPISKQQKRHFLRNVSADLLNSDFVDKKYLFTINKARTPVIKCRDNVFEIEFDIIVSDDSPIIQCQYLQKHLEEKKYLKPFVVLLKYFLRMRNLHDSRNGGLCSYAQFLILVHFFELNPLIQCGLIDPAENLGQCFIDFFQFYGFHNIYEGVSIDITNKSYKKQTMGSSIISLEDPVNKTHDVGDNCTLVYHLKDVFKFSYRIIIDFIQNGYKNGKENLAFFLHIDQSIKNFKKRIVDIYIKNKVEYDTNQKE